MPDIQWMNLDPVKLMEELSQFTSLEGFKEMLDKAQVGHTITHSQAYGIKRLFIKLNADLLSFYFFLIPHRWDTLT